MSESKNHYQKLLVGAEDWAIQQVEEEIKLSQTENTALLSALVKLNAFINDLSASNLGFLGKMTLQDYAQWNHHFGFCFPHEVEGCVTYLAQRLSVMLSQTEAQPEATTP